MYADGTCVSYQHEDVKKNENVLNKDFSSLCQWLTIHYIYTYLDNILPIHFREDKNKSSLFSKTRRLRGINISFAGHSIKQHETVEYLDCQLDSKLRGEVIASKALKK